MERVVRSTSSHQIMFFIIFIALGVQACTGKVDSRATEEAVEPVAVTLDTLFTIGGPDGPVEEYLARGNRGGPVLMDVGPDGLIWVYNPIAKGLRVFDKEGQRLVVMGGAGQGPGEFQQLLALSAVEGGAWTWDRLNQQLCLWSIDEHLVDTWRTELPHPHFNKAVIDEQGTIWYVNEDLEEPEYEKIPLDLCRVPLGGNPEVVTTLFIPGVVVPGRGGTMSMVLHMAPGPGGGVIVTPNHTYELQWFTLKSNEPVRTWQFASCETPYSERQLQPGGRGGFSYAGGDMIEPPLLPHQPDIQSLIKVNQEELWVITPVRNDDGMARVDRIDIQGNRTASMWFSRGYAQVCYAGDRLYSLGYGADGSQQVFGIHMSMESGR